MERALDAEEWRDIVGAAGKYRVSDQGRVAGPNGVLTHIVTPEGYRRVNLHLQDGRRQRVVHKLVAEAFLGEQPAGTEVHLRDGDKGNVGLPNVAYVLRGTGAAKATGATLPGNKPAPRKRSPGEPRRIGPGRALRGEECGRAILTEAEARSILLAYVRPAGPGRVIKKEPSLSEIAEMYSVSKSTIRALISGQNWRHLHLQLFGGLPATQADGAEQPSLNPKEAGEWALARARLIRQTKATARQGGTVHLRTMKVKELRAGDLGALLDDLINHQGYRCAQTGVRFDEGDRDLRASLDRVDSCGHYERANLQLVTSWYNFAKGSRTDSETRRLLGVHAGLFEGDAAWPPLTPLEPE